jgi:hypothetical protein
MVPAMVRETTVADIRWVCAHLRAEDAAEQFACRFPGDDTPEALARSLIAAQDTAIISRAFAAIDETPIAIMSAYLVAPGVAKTHRISTTEWSSAVYLTMHRFGVEHFWPAINAAGIRRVECSILAKYGAAQKMLEGLGFQLEGIARARGRNGEDFCNLAVVLV